MADNDAPLAALPPVTTSPSDTFLPGTARAVPARRPRLQVVRRLQARASRLRVGLRNAKGKVRGAFSGLRARLSGRRFGTRQNSKAEVGTSARRNAKRALLTIGRATIAVFIGVATAVAADFAVQRFITKNKGVRIAVHAGIAVVFWFVGGAVASASLGSLLKVVGLSHGISGIAIVGIDAMQTLPDTGTAAPAAGAR